MPNKIKLAIGYCPYHSKLLYMSRKDARKVARQHHPTKSVYPCSVMEGYFHVGRLDPMVKQGHISKEARYSNQ